MMRVMKEVLFWAVAILVPGGSLLVLYRFREKFKL